MGKYRIEIRQSVLKDLAGIPQKDFRRIMSSIKSLATNPRPAQCRKLSADDKYRLRVGVYRILYSIEDEKLIVYVVKVSHRKDIYKKRP